MAHGQRRIVISSLVILIHGIVFFGLLTILMRVPPAFGPYRAGHPIEIAFRPVLPVMPPLIPLAPRPDGPPPLPPASLIQQVPPAPLVQQVPPAPLAQHAVPPPKPKATIIAPTIPSVPVLPPPPVTTATSDPCAPSSPSSPSAADRKEADPGCARSAPTLVIPGGIGFDEGGQITRKPGLIAGPDTRAAAAEERRVSQESVDKLSSIYGKPVFVTPQRYETDRVPIVGTTPFQKLRGRIDRLFSPSVQQTK